MVFPDKVSMDDALQSVVREDLLRVKLMPQPKPLKVPPPPTLPPGPRPSGAGGKCTKGGKEVPEPRQALQEGQLFGISGWVVSENSKGLQVLALL